MMLPRARLKTLFFVSAGGVLSIAGLGVLIAQGNGAFLPGAFVAGAVLAILALTGALWLGVEAVVLRPLESLAQGLGRVILGSTHAPSAAETARLAPLGRLAGQLCEELVAARRETERNVATAHRRLDQERRQREAILENLRDGVMVCTNTHQLVLCNPLALRLLHVTGGTIPGGSVFSLLTREPIAHTFDRLVARVAEGRHRNTPQGATAPFVCGTTDARVLLEARMNLILDAEDQVSGYVLTIADITETIVTLGQRDSLLRAATEGMRATIANLCAASEMLVIHPDMSAEQRAAFDHVMFRESATLSERIQMLAARYRDLSTGQWPMSDIHSANLLSAVIRRLSDAEDGIQVTMTGIPLWLHGDSHSLLLALEHLIRKLHDHSGGVAFDIEALLGERRLTIEIVWKGAPVPSGILESWLDAPLHEAMGSATVREVLEHHKSEVWSQVQRPGFARLRLPLPLAAPQATEGAMLPARPEFYDFDRLHEPEPDADMANLPLRALEFVTFDVETTGLMPGEGDEIVALGAIRVAQGRILTADTFERLIDPNRPIPPAATAIHRITDAMVSDKPPLGVVLPQFRAFVGVAALIAHNAPFDMKFLRLKAEESGVSFAMPVLDTLLLSVVLDGHGGDHGLAMAVARAGLSVTDLNTAIGDAMASAALFVSMLDRLEERGIVTLADAIQACNKAVESRIREIHA